MDLEFRTYYSAFMEIIKTNQVDRIIDKYYDAYGKEFLHDFPSHAYKFHDMPSWNKYKPKIKTYCEWRLFWLKYGDALWRAIAAIAAIITAIILLLKK